MRVSLKNNDLFCYTIKENIIEYVSEQKCLGVYYDCKMTSDKHVNHIIKKAFKTFNTLKFVNKRQWDFIFKNI